MRRKKAQIGELPDCLDRSIIIRPVEEIAGVTVPEDILFFDCRSRDDRPTPKAHYGESLWGGELAAYSLGLRLSWRERHDALPSGIQFYFDSRKPEESGETARVVKDIIAQYRRDEKLYQRATRNQAGPGEGGGVYYKAVACYLTNFGGGVVADRRNYVISKGSASTS